jgi:cell wall-associated NlpC family hydrolase
MTAQLRLLVLVLVSCWLLAVGAAQAAAGGATTRLVRSKAFSHGAVGFAKRYLGVPYRYGGSSPGSGFDCSGLVSFVYRHFGIFLPRTSYDQFRVGRSVPRSELRPGDLVFFGSAGHVGMYVGGGRFIHAPSSGRTVQVSSLAESWYRSRYDGARRLVAKPLRRVARSDAARLEKQRAVAALARWLRGG